MGAGEWRSKGVRFLNCQFSSIFKAFLQFVSGIIFAIALKYYFLLMRWFATIRDCKHAQIIYR